jgi:threonylcarbamoyladenosine tRNA methylthiotransferase MtaB
MEINLLVLSRNLVGKSGSASLYSRMTTFYIEQFGCRATQADGAAIERQLRDRGCLAVSNSAAADFVVVNTCTVTAAADSQARDAIRKIHARNPAARLIVTGCYAQRAPEELAALPGVSWVVGNSHKPQIPELAANFLKAAPLAPASRSSFVPAESLLAFNPSENETLSPASAPAKILTGDIFAQTTFLAAPVLGGEGNHTRPTLKIQDGCNSRCSYF